MSKKENYSELTGMQLVQQPSREDAAAGLRDHSQLMKEQTWVQEYPQNCK